MSFTQICILILGSSSIYIVGRKEPWRKWGFLIGLCGQPFWFYTAYVNQQWAIALMCLFYTYSWGNGVWTHLLGPWLNKKRIV